MKLSITVGTNDAFSGALVVFRGLEESLQTIADLGYQGIELALFNKKNVNVKQLKNLLRETSLKLPVISTGQIFTMENAWFTHPDKETRERAVEIFCGIIEVASEFGADINVSRVRGYIHEEDTYDSAIEKLTECLEKVSSYAGNFGLNILLEQMNRYETNYMFSAMDVGEYIRKTGIPNLKIHADLFHMNIEDVSIIGTLKEYKKELGYIHFADSNRLAPGSGNIDFKSVINTLEDINYEGWTGIEVLTKPDGYTAAKQSIEYLSSLS